MIVRAFLLTVGALALLWLTPGHASACLWNPSHGGNPFPPCPKEDSHTHQRILQVTANMLASVEATRRDIGYLKREVQAVREDIEEARDYYDRIRDVYGTIAANPLAAILATYNNSAPISKLFVLTAEGWVAQLDPEDLRVFARGYLEELRAEALSDFRVTYAQAARRADRSIGGISRDLDGVPNYLATTTRSESYAVQRAREIQGLAEEIGERYSEVSSVDGLSEARIAKLAASLAKIRGTSFEAEMTAQRARNRGFELGYQARRNADRNLPPPAFVP